MNKKKQKQPPLKTNCGVFSSTDIASQIAE